MGTEHYLDFDITSGQLDDHLDEKDFANENVQVLSHFNY